MRSIAESIRDSVADVFPAIGKSDTTPDYPALRAQLLGEFLEQNKMKILAASGILAGLIRQERRPVGKPPLK